MKIISARYFDIKFSKYIAQIKGSLEISVKSFYSSIKSFKSTVKRFKSSIKPKTEDQINEFEEDWKNPAPTWIDY